MKITNFKDKNGDEVNIAVYEGPEDENELKGLYENVRMNKTNAIVNNCRTFIKDWAFLVPKTKTEKPLTYRLVKDMKKVLRLSNYTEDDDPGAVADLLSVDFKGNKKNYTFKITEETVDFADLIEVVEEDSDPTLILSTDAEGWNVSGTTLSFTSGATLAQTGVLTITATKDEVEKSSTMKAKIDNALYAELTGSSDPTPLNVQITKLPSANAPKDANEAICKANQDAVTVTQSGDTVTVTGDLSALQESESSNPSQGTAKWVALVVNTGKSYTSADIYYNGEKLPASEFTEAQDLGLSGSSNIILWIKAEVVAETPKVIKLLAKEKDSDTIIKTETTITINFVNTAA